MVASRRWRRAHYWLRAGPCPRIRCFARALWERGDAPHPSLRHCFRIGVRIWPADQMAFANAGGARCFGGGAMVEWGTCSDFDADCFRIRLFANFAMTAERRDGFVWWRVCGNYSCRLTATTSRGQVWGRTHASRCSARKTCRELAYPSAITCGSGPRPVA